MDLQKIMDRSKWCAQPLHLCKIADDGSIRKGKLVKYDFVRIPLNPQGTTTRRLEGIFRDHSRYRCKDGEKPCIRGNPQQCDYLYERNDELTECQASLNDGECVHILCANRNPGPGGMRDLPKICPLPWHRYDRALEDEQ